MSAFAPLSKGYRTQRSGQALAKMQTAESKWPRAENELLPGYAVTATAIAAAFRNARAGRQKIYETDPALFRRTPFSDVRPIGQDSKNRGIWGRG
jgi:hypothetical protein